MLSELITNWTIYANKVPAELFIPPVTLITNELVLLSYNPYMYVPKAALITLVVIVAINLAVGILPNVDNFAHLGGFIAGFLLGFVLLIRPQCGWVSQNYAQLSKLPVKSKFKAYQRGLWIISLILVVVW